MKADSPNLESMLDRAYTQARRVMIGTNEQLLPAFLIFYQDGTSGVIGTPFQDDTQRQIVAALMREHMRTRNALAYCFVTEGWQATIDRDEPLGAKPIREREEKKEIVIAIATDGVNQKMRQWGIVRDRRGRCKALPLEHEGAPSVGWVTNLLGGTA